MRMQLESPRKLAQWPLGVALVPIAILLVGLNAPRFGGDFTMADILIFGIVAASVLRSDKFRAADAVTRLALPITLITAGGLIGAIHTGLRGWIFAELVRDAAVFLAFICSLDLLRRGGARVVRACFVALGCIMPLVVVQLLANHGALRASGTFPNPNIPAHLLASALIVWSQAPFAAKWRRLIYVISAVGLLYTASFGSILQLVVGFGYLAIASRGRSRIRLGAVVGVAMIGLVALGVYATLASNSGTGLNQRRLNRSSSTRLDLWEQGLRSIPRAPLGIGPGSARSLGVDSLDKQLHNEPLAFLVERGAMGLAGLLLLWGALWKLGRPGGIARALLLAYIVASIFRDTLHYRHFWLLLALALVTDEISSAKRRSVEAQPALRA
jgi:O-antigen ligase